jgi:tripartite-type tricarboxylate transporter receptor subunit TctC
MNGVLYLPEGAGGQLEMIYRPLGEVWEKNDFSLEVVHTPGRGGSYAWSSLLLPDAPKCALAVLQLPSFLFLTRTRNSMVSSKEVTPMAVFAFAPHALWVAEDSPWKSLGDLLAFARDVGESDPARLIVAGSGSYTDQHLASLAFDRAAGVKSHYYPVAGSAEAVLAVKERRAHACWGYALAHSMPGLRPLAVAGNARSAVLPDVPTCREEGVDLVGGSHFGVGMAQKTPKEVKRAVAERIIFHMADPAARKAYAALGVLPLALAADDMEAFLTLRRKEVEEFLREYPLLPRR